MTEYIRNFELIAERAGNGIVCSLSSDALVPMPHAPRGERFA
jgi:hypothetical protein